MKALVAILIAASLVSSGFFLTNYAVAAPNENASDTARQNAQVKIPSHAVQIAPGIYHIGTAMHEGMLVEGIMAFHHRDGHDKGPRNGDPVPTSSCYSLLAKDAKWKSNEPWILNPENNENLDHGFLLNNLAANIQKWEDAAGSEVFGDGSSTSAGLEADTVTPDGANEIYFADIEGDTAIAVTITWGIFSGKPSDRVLVEWDQVYDQVSFDWANNGDPEKMDFENIATHEIGHALGLGHPDSSCTEETMFAFADNGETKKQTLENGDITGINKLY